MHPADARPGTRVRRTTNGDTGTISTGPQGDRTTAYGMVFVLWDWMLPATNPPAEPFPVPLHHLSPVPAPEA